MLKNLASLGLNNSIAESFEDGKSLLQIFSQEDDLNNVSAMVGETPEVVLDIFSIACDRCIRLLVQSTEKKHEGDVSYRSAIVCFISVCDGRNGRRGSAAGEGQL
jgi:hypothetical protein